MRGEKTRCSNQWTEARFFGFIRSNLRRMTLKWPPRIEAERRERRAYSGPNKRQKWEYKCVKCGDWFQRNGVEQHHKVECGALTCFADLPAFCERLFAEVDGWEFNCKACHQELTNKSRESKQKDGKEKSQSRRSTGRARKKKSEN